MNKEHIEQLAKEFCQAEGMPYKVHDLWIAFFTKFIASLIEKGQVSESDNYKQLKEVLIFQRERIKELEKEAQNYRDNTGNEWSPCKFGDTLPGGHYIVMVERNELLQYQYMVIDYLNPTVWYYYATAYFEINLPATNKRS